MTSFPTTEAKMFPAIPERSRETPGPSGAQMINGRLLAIGRGEPIQTEIHPALASEEPVINIQHFSLWYGQKQALFDITLPVSRGKITAMIGPSG